MEAEHARLALTDRRAALLGLIQGPTELLPVSSSAHISLVPWLARWPWLELDAEARKSFEIALHGGTAAALLIGLRAEIADELRHFDRRRASVVALSFAPPAVAGLALERRIEALGTPRATAAGLVTGALAMALADRSPRHRGRGDAGALDGLLLGIAQACALVPGVSRNGATLTAARARRFGREHANLLSRTVALPVILGAVGLKCARLARRGIAPGTGRSLAIGTGAAFVSTLASQRLIGLIERDRPLWPFAAYRFGLAAVVLRRLRQVESAS